jgi:hypothetical protein
MRICPTCRTQYTDDTLRYCLQDGAELVERLESDTPTVAFKKEHETVEHSAQTSSRSGVTTSSDEELTRFAPPIKAAAMVRDIDSSCRRAGVLLVVVVAGAIGTWLYLKDSGKVSTSSNNANVNANGSLSGNSGTKPPTPIPFPSNTPTSTPLPTPTPQVDSEEARKEVSQTIHGWKSMAESKNLDAYMGNYADTVDYYNHSGASRSYVRSDKSRAFEMYDSIRVDLSNMNVSVDSGTRQLPRSMRSGTFEGRVTLPRCRRS